MIGHVIPIFTAFRTWVLGRGQPDISVATQKGMMQT